MGFLKRLFGADENSPKHVSDDAATLAVSFLQEPNQTLNAATLAELMTGMIYGLMQFLNAHDVDCNARKLSESYVDTLTNILTKNFGVSEDVAMNMYAKSAAARFQDYNALSKSLVDAGATYEELSAALLKRLAEYVWAARGGKNAAGEPTQATADFLERANAFMEVSAFGSTRLQAFYRRASSLLS